MKNISLFQPKICDAAITAVSDVLKSGWIGLGPKTEQFEQDFSNYIKAKHSIALNSATSALHLAMKLINLQEGDEVISTSLTFISTNCTILYEKGVPVFADVLPNTLNIDPESVRSKITKKTKAIIAVHYGGYPCDIKELQNIARDYNLVLIEDCAHACGASYFNNKIGSISSINCFSFHAVKNLPISDGGMITTNNEFYADRLRKLRWLGIDKSTHDRTQLDGKQKSIAYAWMYNVEEVGFKYHMNDVMAAIGIEQLKLLDFENERRREICKMYRNNLKNVEFLKEEDENIKSANHLFVIKTEKRDDLIFHLKNHGIAPGVHYLRNDKFKIFDNVHLPVVESIQDKILSLPLHLHLTDDDVQYVIDAINGFHS